MKVKRSYGERIGYAIILIVMITYALTTLYPFWHVLMYSISDSRDISLMTKTSASVS